MDLQIEKDRAEKEFQNLMNMLQEAEAQRQKIFTAAAAKKGELEFIVSLINKQAAEAAPKKE